MKRQFRHTRRGYPPTCCWGGIHLFDIPPFKEISNSATAFCRIHPRLKKPWYSAKADKKILIFGKGFGQGRQKSGAAIEPQKPCLSISAEIFGFLHRETSWKKFPNQAFHSKIKRMWRVPAPEQHLLRRCSLSRQATLLLERHRNKTVIALRSSIHPDNWSPRTLLNNFLPVPVPATQSANPQARLLRWKNKQEILAFQSENS